LFAYQLIYSGWPFIPFIRNRPQQIAGAGSAGCGVAATLLQGMVEQGMNRERARRNFYMCDKDGLLGVSRKDVGGLCFVG